MAENLHSKNEFLDTLEKRIDACEQAVGVHLGPASSNELPVVLQILRLQQQMANIFQGNFIEFQEQYKELRVLLDDKAATASNLLLSTQAKKEYLILNEESIMQTAAQLRQVNHLMQFVNPPELSDLDNYNARIRILEASGASLTSRALQLQRKVYNLAETYSTVINLTSVVFKEWHDMLTKKETTEQK